MPAKPNGLSSLPAFFLVVTYCPGSKNTKVKPFQAYLGPHPDATISLSCNMAYIWWVIRKEILHIHPLINSADLPLPAPVGSNFPLLRSPRTYQDACLCVVDGGQCLQLLLCPSKLQGTCPSVSYNLYSFPTGSIQWWTLLLICLSSKGCMIILVIFDCFSKWHLIPLLGVPSSIQMAEHVIN